MDTHSACHDHEMIIYMSHKSLIFDMNAVTSLFGYKVTKSREQNKTNSFVFYAET